MNIIEERDERTERRKKMKKFFDSVLTLNAPDNRKRLSVLASPIAERPERFRLLDEGAVVTDDGIDFYIMKGTLKKFYDALPEDFVGSVNLGHAQFATFPYILGAWSKENLHLEDMGDGRMALYVDNTIDYDSVFVQELLRMPYSIGVSGEFGYHVDEEASREQEIEMLDEIFLFAYALVGDAGNVNSSNIELSKKGDTNVTFKELSEKLGVEDVAPEVTEEVAEATVAEEVSETPEEPTEDPEEPAEEPAGEPAEEPEEEPVEEPVEEPTEEPEEDEVGKMMAVMADVIEKQNAKIEALTGQLAELSTALAAKDKALSASTEKAKKYGEQFKSLYSSLADDTHEEPVKSADVYTDGAGEF